MSQQSDEFKRKTKEWVDRSRTRNPIWVAFKEGREGKGDALFLPLLIQFVVIVVIVAVVSFTLGRWL